MTGFPFPFPFSSVQGPGSLHVEEGLVEQAKSFRGKTSAEPRPNWNPLILPVSELCQFSDKIHTSYRSLTRVSHRFHEAAANTVLEEHLSLGYADRDLITAERCAAFMKALPPRRGRGRRRRRRR
jgi:hypothetical protein